MERLLGIPGVGLFGLDSLRTADPLLRHAARVSLENNIDEWRDQILSESRRSIALPALLALARSNEKTDVGEIIGRLPFNATSDFDVEQSLMLVQIYLLCLEQAPDVVAARKEQIFAQLGPLFPHPATGWLHVAPSGTGASLERDLARLLVQLGWPEAVEKISKSLLVSSVQEDRLHALFLLRNISTGWTPETRRTCFTALREGDSFLGGEGMPKFLAHIREEAVATLSESERRDLADLLAPITGSAENEALPPARPVVKQWSLDDFLPLLTDSSRVGDAARGATVFRDALCVRCHRAGLRRLDSTGLGFAHHRAPRSEERVPGTASASHEHAARGAVRLRAHPRSVSHLPAAGCFGARRRAAVHGVDRT
jgi:hypothetical protein